MPTVLRAKGYSFFFYAGDCSEPRHMHAEKGGNEAKYWLDPVRLAFNHGFRRHDLREIEQIIEDNLDYLRQAWDTFCGP